MCLWFFTYFFLKKWKLKSYSQHRKKYIIYICNNDSILFYGHFGDLTDSKKRNDKKKRQKRNEKKETTKTKQKKKKQES